MCPTPFFFFRAAFVLHLLFCLPPSPPTFVHTFCFCPHHRRARERGSCPQGFYFLRVMRPGNSTSLRVLSFNDCHPAKPPRWESPLSVLDLFFSTPTAFALCHTPSVSSGFFLPVFRWQAPKSFKAFAPQPLSPSLTLRFCLKNPRHVHYRFLCFCISLSDLGAVFFHPSQMP